MFRDPFHFERTIVKKTQPSSRRKDRCLLATEISVSRKSDLSAMQSNAKYDVVAKLAKTNSCPNWNQLFWKIKNPVTHLTFKPFLAAISLRLFIYRKNTIPVRVSDCALFPHGDVEMPRKIYLPRKFSIQSSHLSTIIVSTIFWQSYQGKSS